MRTFQRTLLAGAVALALSSPAAAQFQNVIVLGDSLSDAGFYGGARFTVNPGLVWAQDFGAFYGFDVFDLKNELGSAAIRFRAFEGNRILE